MSRAIDQIITLNNTKILGATSRMTQLNATIHSETILSKLEVYLLNIHLLYSKVRSKLFGTFKRRIMYIKV